MSGITLTLNVDQSIGGDAGNVVERIVCQEIVSHFGYTRMKATFLRWWGALQPLGEIEFTVTDQPDNLVELLADLGFDQICTEYLNDWRILIKARKADLYTDARRSWQIDVHPGDRVLEVGPGAHPCGFATQYFDIVTPSGDLKGVPLDLGTVEALPYGDQSFDVVIASHVLEHTDHPVQAVAELQRVGKRGVVECPSAAKDWILQEGHVHAKWQVTRTGNQIVFVALTPDQIAFLSDENARNYIYRVTQYQGADSYLAFTLRRMFWQNEAFLNPVVTWDEQHRATAVVVR